MIQFTIEHLDEVSSTNTLLRERANQGAPEGLVIAASHQTAGRGKPGRTWESPKGKNLLFSVLLRPPLKPAEAPMLTQVACRTIAKILTEKYDIQSSFKRPNDVLVNGKKICGILTEAVTKASRLEAVVLGIGLNVNAGPEELPPEATSMAIATGRSYELDEILDSILLRLNSDLEVLYRKNNA